MFGIAGHEDFNNEYDDYHQQKTGDVMKCRRYRITNGKLETYYTDEKITGHNWGGGYYANVNNPKLISEAPAGTTYVYLNCLREWGYTEEIPDPQCTVFGSPKMMAILNDENKTK